MLMYDSVTLTEIPRYAEAVAGYTSGRWPTFPQLAAMWPKAHRLSIAVSAEHDADCLDIENGDASPAQAPAWVRRQKAHGLHVPTVYCSVSSLETVLGVLRAAGIGRGAVRVWTAHYTNVPHRCGPSCGFGVLTAADATQFTNRALGRNLDASLVSAAFFGTGQTAAARRRLLRAWVVAQHLHGVSWAKLKTTANWKIWRKLGGK